MNSYSLTLKLEKRMALFIAPEIHTHYNRSPHDTSWWHEFAKEKGFKPMGSSPEHSSSKWICEWFNGDLLKIIHAAIVEGKDSKIEMQRRLINYWNTPHPFTWNTPSALMMSRVFQAKIPLLIKPINNQTHKNALKIIE